MILLRYIKKQRATPYAKEEDARMVDPFVLSHPTRRNQSDILRNMKPEDLLMARWATSRSSIEEPEELVVDVSPPETTATAEQRASGASTSGATAGVVCALQNDAQPPVSTAPDAELEMHARMVRKLARLRAEMAQWKAGTRRMKQGDMPLGLGPV